jgi:hypothetical protein
MDLQKLALKAMWVGGLLGTLSVLSHASSYGVGYSTPTFSCPGGILCDGTPITGTPADQKVCGMDLQMWGCTDSGWQHTGGACQCVSVSTPSYSCPGGILCGGTPVTGTPNQQVCGADLHSWTCTAQGWHATGWTCSCYWVCPGGTLCNGMPVTGTPNEQVCGLDLQMWACTGGGWNATGAPCTCSE